MKKRIVSILAFLLVLLTACGQSAPTWQEQYDLGVRYLSEGNYEEAIIAFTAAIEIDPKHAEAYLDLADIYTEQSDVEKAVEVLKDAIAAVGETDELLAALDALTAKPEPESNPDFVIENGVLVEYVGPGGAVVIPNSVTAIGERAFQACTSLTSVTIPSSVTTIGGSAFMFSSLISVTIPGGVTTIGRSAFRECESLTSVTISSGVTTIGDFAFYLCESLTSVTIPNSVTTIGKRAFAGCDSLTSVSIPSGVSLGKDAFDNSVTVTYR